jgi:hypothetical protein
MKLYKIKTTSWSYEDFLLVTTLSVEDIVKVIRPIVQAEREEYGQYTNESLVDALKKRYPSETIDLYYEPNTITI